MLMEEICWRQKSCSLWLKEGDKNTKFFHRCAKTPRRKNAIGQLAIDGAVFIDPEEINTRIVDFYENLFSEIGVRWHTLDDLPSAIERTEADYLHSAFSEEEVFEV